MGRTVAAYLAERAPVAGIRWAAAARDLPKLQRVLDRVDADPSEVIMVDIGDKDSVARVASRARVILNLVGPTRARGAR
jgi:short subunit dehydrogenase-like uncharacterized protein